MTMTIDPSTGKDESTFTELPLHWWCCDAEGSGEESLEAHRRARHAGDRVLVTEETIIRR